MNELGETSESEHKKSVNLRPWPVRIAYYCWQNVKKHLAPIAEKNGCKVISFDTALEAGEFLKNSDIKEYDNSIQRLTGWHLP